MGSAVVRGLGLRASPSLLRSLGFVSENSLARLQNLNLHVGEEHSPAVSLLLETHQPLGESLDGIPCSRIDQQDQINEECHPNGVTRCDHIVVRTPDWARTASAFEKAGWQEALVRDDVYPGTRLSFFRVGSKGNNLTLELVAPLAKKPGKEEVPARIWGVTWVAGGGLEAVAAALGDGFHLSAGKPAIQPGRRIATLRGDAGGLAMAFMTPKENTL